MSADSTRTAILFRTHFWDGFAQRQFDRLLRVAAGADVYVLVDETNGAVANIPHDRIVGVTETQLLAMGLANAGEGNLLWFNGDYPLYYFLDLHPGYDFYLQLEYDVVINGVITAMIDAAQEGGVDAIALTKGEAVSAWPWTHTCLGTYEVDKIEHQLICLSLFSRRALAHLRARRLELSARHAAGTLQGWPMCEAFIATELAGASMVRRELSEFGDTSLYDHWPPFLEADLKLLEGHDFIHPVLDEARYTASMLKYHVGLNGYLDPWSLYHRKLRRLPVPRYLRALGRSFAGKAARTLREAAASARERLGRGGALQAGRG